MTRSSDFRQMILPNSEVNININIRVVTYDTLEREEREEREDTMGENAGLGGHK